MNDIIKIAICDDDNFFADSLKNLIKGKFKAINVDCVVQAFYCYNELYSVLQNEFFDLLILDIEIGNYTGIDLANKIRDELKNSKSLIAYISSHSHYHMQGQLYRGSPIQFISKPVKAEEINSLVETVCSRVNYVPTKDDYFIYSIKTDKFLLLKNDIYYFENDLRKVTIVTADKKATFISSMDKVKKQINEPYFVVSHKSFLINLHYIENHDAKKIIMRNGDEIPISNRQREEFQWAIANYYNKDT